MSAIINDPSLQVYLKLDRLSEANGIKSTADFSQYKKSAVVTGTPVLAADDQFANSLQLNGTQDFVEFPDPFANDTAFTLSIWVRPDALNDGAFHGIMGHQGPGGLTSRKPSLWLMPNNKGLHYDSYTATGQRFMAEIPNFFEDAAEWVHIAWVKDGTQYLLYRNGILFYQAAAPAQFARTATLPYQVGRAETYFWKGRLSHARVYSRALTAEEINWDMDEDRTAMAAFRSTHPVSFTLSSGGHENVLYIVADPAKQTLDVTVQNDSRSTIDFEATAVGDAGPDAHHFSLHFRPGALSGTSVNSFPNVKLDGWKKGLIRKTDGGVILYFLKTKAFSLTPGQTISLSLTGVSADPKGGARNTVVELHFREKPIYSANDKLPSRYRTQQISIVNHLGQTHFPVHFGAVGSNRVLNDGASSTDLTFHLANLLPVTDPAHPERAYIRFKGKTNNPTEYTKLILTFDTQLPNTTREWALCKSDEMAGTQPQITGWVQESVDLNIQSPNWTFRRDADLDLKAGEFIEIKLNGIKSSLPSGLTRITLRYENAAGYWDGQLTAPVEKSPMIFRPNGAVGIGNAYAATSNYMAKGSLTIGGTAQNYGGGNSWNNNTAGLMLECATNTEIAVHDSGTRLSSLFYYEGDANNRITIGRDMGWGKTNVRIAGNLSIEGSAPAAGADNLQIGHFGNNADTYLSVRSTGGNKFKVGLKFRHFSDDYGYTLVSDETTNAFQLIGHWVNAPSVPVLHIGRITERDYRVGMGTTSPAANLHVSGGPGAAELLIEADIDNKGNESAMLTFKKKGGTAIGQLGLPDAGNTDLLLINQNSQSAIRLSGNGSVILANSTKDAFVVQTDGNTVLYRNGQPKWATNTVVSDINLKTGVESIQSPLQRLTSLHGISFRWKDDCFGKNREIGLVAQEVEQVFPELMNTLDQGAKLVQYEKFVPVLIEAIKEQQKMIEKLSEQIEALAS